MAWDKVAAKEATQHATQELNKMLESMTPEQLAGVDHLRQWIAKWYNGASGYHPTGYKPLCRMLIFGNGQK